jgi:hypothetical protein
VAEVAKAFQRLTAAGTAPVSHRIPFSDEIQKTEKPINQDMAKVEFFPGLSFQFTLRYFSSFTVTVKSF